MIDKTIWILRFLSIAYRFIALEDCLVDRGEQMGTGQRAGKSGKPPKSLNPYPQ